jgi:hypothetical protein
MLQAPEVPRLVPVSKRDSNAGIDKESIVLPAEHGSGVLPAEKTLPTNPPHQPAAHPLGAVARSDAVRGRAA